jgi:hypothetical protein
VAGAIAARRGNGHDERPGCWQARNCTTLAYKERDSILERVLFGNSMI